MIVANPVGTKPPTVCRPVAVSKVRSIARQTKSTKLMLAYTPLASRVSSKKPQATAAVASLGSVTDGRTMPPLG